MRARDEHVARAGGRAVGARRPGRAGRRPARGDGLGAPALEREPLAEDAAARADPAARAGRRPAGRPRRRGRAARSGCAASWASRPRRRRARSSRTSGAAQVAAPARGHRRCAAAAAAAGPRRPPRTGASRRSSSGWPAPGTAAGAGGLRCLALDRRAGHRQDDAGGRRSRGCVEAARGRGAATGAATSRRSCPSSRGWRRWSALLGTRSPGGRWPGSPSTTARWRGCCPPAARSPPAVAGPRERYLAFEAVRGLLEQHAAGRPVLIVLDDVHWADADSLALLRHLARAAADGAGCCCCCARGTPSSPARTPRRCGGPAPRRPLAEQ